MDKIDFDPNWSSLVIQIESCFTFFEIFIVWKLLLEKHPPRHSKQSPHISLEALFSDRHVEAIHCRDWMGQVHHRLPPGGAHTVPR